MQTQTYVMGDLIEDRGVVCKIVGFRQSVRAPLITEPTPGERLFPVLVEQSGDYRIFTRSPRVRIGGDA